MKRKRLTESADGFSQALMSLGRPRRLRRAGRRDTAHLESGWQWKAAASSNTLNTLNVRP
jgi:hypothetical protein